MSKPRMVVVTDRAEIDALKADLGGPMPFEDENGVWCDADELRAWRGLQNTSTGKS